MAQKKRCRDNDADETDDMTETEYLNKIREICVASGADRVVLFGSRAKKTNRPNSDFDIAVFGLDDVSEIQEELDDLPTLYSADVVSMDKCGNINLREDILKYGIQI